MAKQAKLFIDDRKLKDLEFEQKLEQNRSEFEQKLEKKEEQLKDIYVELGKLVSFFLIVITIL